MLVVIVDKHGKTDFSCIDMKQSFISLVLNVGLLMSTDLCVWPSLATVPDNLA